ncbi:WD40-repeat-containing domain protein [Aspergillus similis]
MGKYLKRDICRLKSFSTRRADIHKEHFLHWLEMMSLMGVLSETLEMMNNTNPGLSSFLSDAIQFIHRHAQIASAVPLQLYASCLVFTPTSSLVRKASEKHCLPWIHALPQVEKSWGANRQTLEGHSAYVNAVAFSPDGQTVASGSDNKTIKLWNAATGEQRQTLKGHSAYVNAVAFSPDGQTVASGSDDKTIKLWNAATGEQRQTLEGHSARVNAVAFSPDGQTVASGSDDKTIKLWNAATGKQRQTLEGHSAYVLAVVSHTKEDASPASDLQSASPISLADQWVYMKGEKVLWLPSEYSLFCCFSTKEGALALGCPSGRVFVIQLLAPN